MPNTERDIGETKYEMIRPLECKSTMYNSVVYETATLFVQDYITSMHYDPGYNVKWQLFPIVRKGKVFREGRPFSASR